MFNPVVYLISGFRWAFLGWRMSRFCSALSPLVDLPPPVSPLSHGYLQRGGDCAANIVIISLILAKDFPDALFVKHVESTCEP